MYFMICVLMLQSPSEWRFVPHHDLEIADRIALLSHHYLWIANRSSQLLAICWTCTYLEWPKSYESHQSLERLKVFCTTAVTGMPLSGLSVC